uniref:Nucleolus and neural progenitor protein n=1 Tax=Cairina moschata TaxID=8855 RepID=A0A8C3CF78_CAIMO
MAAGEAAWNRLELAWPAGSHALPVEAPHPAVRSLPELRRRCLAAVRGLRGRGPAVEGRVLRGLLYAYRRRLLRHRPYLALQQVEQCLKRLWKMNLVGSIETLAELIPKKNKFEAHAECLVPSQPMLETVAVKVLGGCKLILRLLDCCCKAFLLSVKHLCSQEYILLNTVASGLLSRLWIQYRCILQSLISLYGVLSASLRLVSETQQMPYIKGFAFPSDIRHFLGVELSSEVKKQKAAILTAKRPTSWVKKLFPDVPKAESEAGNGFVTCESAMKNASVPTDVGEPVLVTRENRGKQLGFDVKSLLRPSRPPTQEDRYLTSTPFKEMPESLSSYMAKLQHTGFLLQLFQTAASFGELSEALRKAILWCKGHKLKPAAYFFRNKLLKSNRLHHVEVQGCSLRKKLCCVKTSLCKYLLYSSQHRCWPKQYLGAQLWQRKVKSSRRLKRTRTARPNQAELFGVCENGALLSVGPSGQAGPPIACTAADKLSVAGTPKRLLRGSVQEEVSDNTDIDSIFAAMGV